MEDKNFYIDDLIIRYLSGKTTPNENKVVSQWVNETSENRLYFVSFRNIWLASAQIDTTLNNTGIAAELINPLLGKHLQTKKVSTDRLIHTAFSKFLKVAAILVVTILIGTWGYQQFSNKLPTNYQNDVVVEVMSGSKAITTLPDGTHVWLNGGSKLTYNKNYNAKIREVNLTGEAYFDVVTNPSKPFVVKAGKLSIKALGTMFNVKAYTDDKSIVTTLVKGKVIIEGKDYMDKPFIIQMKPKETVTYNKNVQTNATEQIKLGVGDAKALSRLEVEDLNAAKSSVVKLEKVKTELYTSWKDERWVIEKQNIEVLARDFERRFNIKIQILSPNIKNFHFTGTIQNETIEQIMVIMRHTIPMKYKIDRGIITIDEDKLLMNEFESNN